MSVRLQLGEIIAKRTAKARHVINRVFEVVVVSDEIGADRNRGEVAGEQIRITGRQNLGGRIHRKRLLAARVVRIEFQQLDEFLCFRFHVGDQRRRLSRRNHDDINALVGN